MAQFRKERLASTMEQLLAVEIVKTVELNEQLITITGISLDERLENATVHIEVFPDAGKQAVLDELARNSKKLQHFLLKKIPIKKIPRLVFD